MTAFLLAVAVPASGSAAGKTAAKTSASATAKTPSKKGASAKKKQAGATAGKKKTAKSGKASTPKETAADVRRRQEAAQKEITQTRQQIKENDAAVRRNLSELGKLEGDIDDSRRKVAETSGKVTALQKQIGGLQSQIAAEEKSLASMRAGYLEAVKKMRARRKEKSMLAFIFSSGSFNEALRRMRYLRQFSDWRDRKTKEIDAKVKSLRNQTDRLAQTKTMHDRALAAEVKARNELQAQYSRQDAIVVELKKNGQALNSHLAKKQAEVNALKGRVAALIAEEQRKAEAERRAREKAEAERAAREKAEAERIERERQERERLLAESPAKAGDATESADGSKSKQENKAQSKKQTPKKSDTPKKSGTDKSKTASGKKSSTGKEAYAEARRRRPKSQQSSESATSGGTSAKSGDKAAASRSTAQSGGFESMKGSLPRPVAGSFRVTSRFGKHSLPDLPDVTYDNPGIDAEVSAGASALAVYAGKVSGVYMIPGYSTVVIVSHGGYYTVYGNIAQAGVSVGDVVKQGQSLGRLAPDEEDPSHSLIHFEVWKNRDKMDPLGWIK